MAHDVYRKFYEKQAEFYRKRRWAKTALFLLNYALTAAIFLAYALLCLLIPILGTPHAKDLAKIFLIPLSCLLAVTLLRNLINRKRPYEDGGITPVLVKNKHGNSFPSRHVASAFVIGTVFLPYCLWAGVAVLLSGVLLGYIRFAAGIHYPSDLLVGAAVGTLFGLTVFL